MRSYPIRRVLKFMLFAVLFVAVLALLGFVVMSLWNWLVPAIFGWKSIGYWQALGLLILSKILLGGFRGPRGRGGFRRHRLMERWNQMTPEEQERFRQGLQGRWSCGASPESKPSI